MNPKEYSEFVHATAAEAKTLVYKRVLDKMKPRERTILVGRIWNLLFSDHFQILMYTAAESEAASLAAMASEEQLETPTQAEPEPLE